MMPSDEILATTHSIFLRYLEDVALDEQQKRKLLIDRARSEIKRLNAEMQQLRELVTRLDRAEIEETATRGSVGPLTPDQQRKRAARDQKRRDRILAIQSSSARRISDIQTTIGK